MSEEFSIGVLAERTGLSPEQLRTWENRFGFPAGRRTKSGHRRFTDTEVELVRRVLSMRQAGVPLRLAIDQISQEQQAADQPSVFASVAAHIGPVPPQQLRRSTLAAVSQAIEEEALARSDRTVVLGAFQRGLRFASVEPRWAELARTATWCAVLADFSPESDSTSDCSVATSSLSRAHLSKDSPMRREWSLIWLTPTSGTVLTAWQLPTTDQVPGTYEALLSTTRDVAVIAAKSFVEVYRTSRGDDVPGVVERMLQAAHGPTPHEGTDRMLARVLHHLDHVTD